MNTTLKRILCIILVISLMMTMTGCAETAAGLAYAASYLFRVGVLLITYGVVIGAMWVVDLVTWPFVQYTGFNVNDLGNRICQAIVPHIMPENIDESGWYGGWFVIRDEDELEAKLREGGHWPQETLGPTDEGIIVGIAPEYEEVMASEPEETRETEEDAEDGEEAESEETGVMDTIVVTVPPVYADATIPTETFQFDSSGTYYTDPVIIYTADKALTDVYNMPEPQPITGNDVITKDVPVRPGYHFMGWARVYAEEDVLDGQKQPAPENETEQQKADREKAEREALERYQESINEPRYFPGQQVDKNNPFQQTTILYAVWKEHDVDAPPYYLNTAGPDHYYTVQQVKSGSKSTPNISISCSCGMTVTERNMLEIDFLIYCKQMKNPLSSAEAADLYRLYLAQDIGPLALEFNTEYYDENILFEQYNVLGAEINSGKPNIEPDFADFFNELGGVCKSVKKSSSVLQKYFKEAMTKKYSETEVELLFKEISVKKLAIQGMKACSVLRLLCASADMLDSEKGILEQTVSMLEVVESAASLTKSGKIAKVISQTLQEGLKLIGKCEQTRNKYQNALRLAAAEGNKDLGKPTITAYLEELMGNTRIAQAYQELVLTGTPGCTCGKSSTCNFDAAGMCLKYFPDVATTIYRMQNTSKEPTPLEKSFLALYLAERSRHDLYKISGLTLEQYADLVG